MKDLCHGKQIKLYTWDTGIYQAIETEDGTYINVIDIRNLRNIKIDEKNNMVEADAHVYSRKDDGNTRIYDVFTEYKCVRVKLENISGNIINKIKMLY